MTRGACRKEMMTWRVILQVDLLNLMVYNLVTECYQLVCVGMPYATLGVSIGIDEALVVVVVVVCRVVPCRPSFPATLNGVELIACNTHN